MAVTPADLLAASLPPRLTFAPSNQSANPTDDPGTPAQATFDNVLASVQSAAPAEAAATPDVPPDTGLSTLDGDALPADLLEAFFDDDPTAADASALGLLLAAVTVNPPAAPTVAPVAVAAVAVSPPAAAVPEAVAAELPPLPPTEVRSRADELRLAQSPAQQLAATAATLQAPTAAATPNPLPAAPADAAPPAATTPRPLPAAAAAVPTAATPADTQRAAARPPSVVPQAPIVADLRQGLPSELPGVATQPVFPPAAPVVEVQPTAAVTPGDQLPVNLRTGVALAQESQPAPTPPPAPPPFAAVLGQEAVVPQPPAPTAAVPPPDQPVEVTAAPLPVPAAPISVEQPAAFTAPPTALPAVRDPNPDAKPVELTDGPIPTGTPVAGLVPQALDARPTASPNAPANATPTVAAQLTDGIVTHARVAERDGAVEFQIRLDPPELGPVKVKITAVGDRLTAEVVVSNDAIRQMVESQLPDLRQRLEQAGVNLPTLDVSTGDRQQGDAQEWERQLFGFRQAAGSPAARRPTPARVATGTGTLDVMV
jgi:flagellar hook-length control protein FliK